MEGPLPPPLATPMHKISTAGRRCRNWATHSALARPIGFSSACDQLWFRSHRTEIFQTHQNERWWPVTGLYTTGHAATLYVHIDRSTGTYILHDAVDTGVITIQVRQPNSTVGMRLLCNFLNVYRYTKPCTRLLNVYTNMEASNRNQMVFSYDNSISITVTNGQQAPVTSVRQPLTKFLHPIIA